MLGHACYVVQSVASARLPLTAVIATVVSSSDDQLSDSNRRVCHTDYLYAHIADAIMSSITDAAATTAEHSALLVSTSIDCVLQRTASCALLYRYRT
jgi:hypothetical protein